MKNISRYLLVIYSVVFCSQLFAADDANIADKESYVSFEDAQAALGDKDVYDRQDDGAGRTAPEWEDDPGAYEFVATLVGGVVFDASGNQLGDDGDILAAFDDADNVRGVSVQLVPGFGPYAGTTVYEITMRSNNSDDVLSFKYYDASADAILDIDETYTFVINDQWGSMIAPVELNTASDGCPACDDTDPGTCGWAPAQFGCDFSWGGTPLSDLCPDTCGTCPTEDACTVCTRRVVTFTYTTAIFRRTCTTSIWA
jgi:hypothetical protein